ncbi:hypothetical protein FLCU109888_11550 [Flavobacterium cucumis]|uniref:Structural protein P5 n=1 Tax=Flavobacterium cucumis TaxID=416016 RepID=A0A1M7ZVK1_9FLAO|nr:hypothetical protein [Flavobacterium cucumis]SHO72886.1 hypothetical protein SAMN05443547_1230 [Flavobacterium cucumis]
MFTSYLNNPSLPRGIRNNNPGNLVRSANAWIGKIPYEQSLDSRFEQFTQLRYGLRALMRDIYNDYSRKGKKTVTEIISEFAPNFENNTTAYISTVIKMIGSNIIGELTQEKMIALSKAIILVENGSAYAKYISDKDYNDAIAILGIPLKKKVVH